MESSKIQKKFRNISSECIRSGDLNTPRFESKLSKFLKYIVSDIEGLDGLEDKRVAEEVSHFLKSVSLKELTSKVPKLERVPFCGVYGFLVLGKSFGEESSLKSWLESNYSGITFDNTSLQKTFEHIKIATEYNDPKTTGKRKSTFFDDIIKKKRKISHRVAVSTESAEEESECAPTGALENAKQPSDGMEVETTMLAPAEPVQTAPVGDIALVQTDDLETAPASDPALMQIVDLETAPASDPALVQTVDLETAPASDPALMQTVDLDTAPSELVPVQTPTAPPASGPALSSNNRSSSTAKQKSSNKINGASEAKSKSKKERPKRTSKPVSRLNLNNKVEDDSEDEDDDEDEDEDEDEDDSHNDESSGSEESSYYDRRSKKPTKAEQLNKLSYQLKQVRLSVGIVACFTFLEENQIELLVNPNSNKLQEVKKGKELFNLPSPIIVVHSDASESVEEDEEDKQDQRPKPKLAKASNETISTKVSQQQNNTNQKEVVEIDDETVDNSKEAKKKTKKKKTDTDKTGVTVTPKKKKSTADDTPKKSEKDVSSSDAPKKMPSSNPQTPESTPKKDKKNKFFLRLSKRSLDISKFNQYSKKLAENDASPSLPINVPKTVDIIPVPFSQCWYDRHLVQVDSAKMLEDCGALAGELIVTSHQITIMSKMLLFVVGTVLDVIENKLSSSLKNSSPAQSTKSELSNKVNEELLKQFEEMTCFARLLAAGLLPDTIRKESLKRKESFRKFKHALSRFTDLCRVCPALLFNDISFHVLVKEAPAVTEFRQTLEKAKKNEIQLEHPISESYFVQWPAAYQPVQSKS